MIIWGLWVFFSLMWFIRSLFLAMLSSFGRTLRVSKEEWLEREGREGGSQEELCNPVRPLEAGEGHQSSAGPGVTSWSWESWVNAVLSRASSLPKAMKLLWLIDLWFELVFQGQTVRKLVLSVVIKGEEMISGGTSWEIPRSVGNRPWEW